MTTAEIAGEHDRLARYVHGHFKRKLTLEDARDAAAEAQAEAETAPDPIIERERWLRRAAWRNALDQIRRLEGEGKVRRLRPTGLGDDVDHLPDRETTDGLVLKAAVHDADTAALARAVEILKPDEHRALHLRYVDDLDVPDVLAILGCSRHHYENLHKRALKKLREALVAPATTADCRTARGLIIATAFGGLDEDDAVRRDAHVETCLPCRAFARRRDGLLAALPLPVAAGFLSRLTALVGGGGAAKTAAVCASTALAAGACTAVEQQATRHHHRAPTTHGAATRPAAARRSAPPASATRAAAPTATQPPSRAPALGTRHRASATTTPASASPFLPESAADPAPPSSNPTHPTASIAATRRTTSIQPPSTPASASFSGEFTP